MMIIFNLPLKKSDFFTKSFTDAALKRQKGSGRVSSELSNILLSEAVSFRLLRTMEVTCLAYIAI